MECRLAPFTGASPFVICPNRTGVILNSPDSSRPANLHTVVVVAYCLSKGCCCEIQAHQILLMID
jgi:hypothetical protein